MFSELWQITVYTKKSPEIQLRSISPPSRSLSVGLCAQETTSHFPSFHVWNFSCARHASSTLYSLGWIHGWRMGYKFSAWCHWSGTCFTTTTGSKVNDGLPKIDFPAVFIASICLQLKLFILDCVVQRKILCYFEPEHNLPFLYATFKCRQLILIFSDMMDV